MNCPEYEFNWLAVIAVWVVSIGYVAVWDLYTRWKDRRRRGPKA